MSTYNGQAGFDTGGGGADWDRPHTYGAPGHLRLNHWGLTGSWTVRSDAAALNDALAGSRSSSMRAT